MTSGEGRLQMDRFPRTARRLAPRCDRSVRWCPFREGTPVAAGFVFDMFNALVGNALYVLWLGKLARTLSIVPIDYPLAANLRVAQC